MASITNNTNSPFMHYLVSPVSVDTFDKSLQFYSSRSSRFTLNPGTTFNVPASVVKELEDNDVFSSYLDKGLMVVHRADEYDTTVTNGITTLAKDKSNPVWQFEDTTRTKEATVNAKEVKAAKDKLG